MIKPETGLPTLVSCHQTLLTLLVGSLLHADEELSKKSRSDREHRGEKEEELEFLAFEHIMN